MDTYTTFEITWGGEKKWKDNFWEALFMEVIHSTMSLGSIIAMKLNPFILINDMIDPFLIRKNIIVV